MKLIRKLFICLCLCLLLSAQQATAQEGDNLPPFEDDLLRLAELLGALELLQPLCDLEERGVWRNQMANLMNALNPPPPRQARFTARYNQSYATLEQVHRSCTPSAREILDRFRLETIELTSQLARNHAPLRRQAAAPPAAASAIETETTVPVQPEPDEFRSLPGSAGVD